MAISIRYPHQTPFVDASGLVNSLADLGDLYQSRRADDKAADAYGAWMQASGAPLQQPMSLASLAPQGQGARAPQMDPASARVASAHAASGGTPPQGAIEAYIRHAAQKRGIDPEIAVKVAMSEGGVTDPTRQSDVVKDGVREQSYGPFQLYMNGGLGNEAMAAGIDPRKDWKGGIDFALDRAREGGWGPWYGAEKVGVTGMMGIGEQQAPQPQQMAQSAPAGDSLLPPPDVMKALLRSPSFKPMAIDMMRTAQAARQGDPEAELRLRKLRAEVQNLENPQRDLPAGVQEYEYAREQGFPGTFQDWESSKKGGMSLQVDPNTGAVSFQQGGNIKPMTEGQSKDTVYATRATGALGLIDQFGDALTSLPETVGGQVPGVGNYMKSPEFQQAEQAGKEFLQAILRKDTGAAITKPETEEYGTVYLPRPGDSPQVLAQKKISRFRAVEAMKAGMPPQAILAMEKALSNTQQAQPAQPGLPAGVSEDDILETMRANNMTREQVMQRLMGGQ